LPVQGAPTKIGRRSALWIVTVSRPELIRLMLASIAISTAIALALAALAGAAQLWL
jgi:hypothetical protein